MCALCCASHIKIGRRRLFKQALVILNCQPFEVRQFVRLGVQLVAAESEFLLIST